MFAHGAILAVALWQRLYAVGSCRPRNRMMPLPPVGSGLYIIRCGVGVCLSRVLSFVYRHCQKRFTE